MREKQTFWGWVSDNPVTVVVLFLVLLGGAALLVGYKEGFMGILGGLLNWIRGGDAENKQRLEETRKNADLQATVVKQLTEEIKEQHIIHDAEVIRDVENAKAFCDDADIDDLVDLGNAILRSGGAFRDTAGRG